MFEEFTITVVDDPADGALLVVSGELDIATGEQLCTRLVPAVVGRHRIVLDLSCVTFCDCSGLRWLLDADRETRRTGATMRLRNVSPAMEKVLHLTGLRPCFAIEADRPACRRENSGGSGALHGSGLGRRTTAAGRG